MPRLLVTDGLLQQPSAEHPEEVLEDVKDSQRTELPMSSPAGSGCLTGESTTCSGPSRALQRRQDTREDSNPSSQSPDGLLQELARAVEACEGLEGEVRLTVREAMRMASLGRALEVRAYKLRPDRLLRAMVLVAAGASKLEEACRPVRGDSLAATEPLRRSGEEMLSSMHSLAEYLDAQLARLQELLRTESQIFQSAPLLSTLCGALGDLQTGGSILPGGRVVPAVSARDGASASSRAHNQRFLAELSELVMQKLPDFLEDDFAAMGWSYPTAFLGESELRRILMRASELQVGVHPESLLSAVPAAETTKFSSRPSAGEAMFQILGFVNKKMPVLTLTLPDLGCRYCKQLSEPTAVHALGPTGVGKPKAVSRRNH
ncbi:unnamed protein product [Polarella glacialis]|uniref:Uncharacterized protein n=1 Tax=Polarella glacialis TaxID=89957 RepID=A0A813J8H8_POLGL|nr:unnamed protein product [Polarella glacialis]